MSVGIFIASAAGWDDRRRAGLKRLQEQLPSAVAVVSEVKEHSSVWSKRLYARALASPHSHLVFLNDDVIACPSFCELVNAMVDAVPDQVMSFATICPEAATHKGNWLRSYLLSGPAYLYPRSDLESLVEFYGKMPVGFREKMNEDEVASHHAWSRQRPIWQSCVSLVLHDINIPSTLGYDHHRGRVSTAPPATHVSHVFGWSSEDDAPTVPHPWLPEGRMRLVARAMANGEDPNVCGYCSVEQGTFTSAATGARICAVCVRDIVGHVFSNLRTS